MANETFEILRIEVAAEEYGVLRQDVQSVQLGTRVKAIVSDDAVDRQIGILRTTEGELPVYRLSDQLGLDADFPIEIQRVLVLRSLHGLWCLLVDRVSQAEVVAAENITPLPQIARAAYVHSVYAKDDDVLLLLDAQRLHPLAEDVVEQTPPAEEAQESSMAPAVASRQRGHLLLFKLIGLNGETDKLLIGLTPLQVDEVLRSADVQAVPAAPQYLHGVTNWRGQLIPVIDLAARLGFNDKRTTPHRQDRLVVAHGGKRAPIAFYAKSDVEIVTLPTPHTATTVPDAIDGRMVRAAALYQGGRTVLVPEFSRLA
jgi:chemotaxis signal transduction protein